MVPSVAYGFMEIWKSICEIKDTSVFISDFYSSSTVIFVLTDNGENCVVEN